MAVTRLYPLLSADFNTLYQMSQRQFSRHLGLHLNSKDWKAYIEPGMAKFYNFLLNGIVKTTTETTTDDKTYSQTIQFSDYKTLENALLLLFLNEVPENEIIEFMATFLYNTNTKVYCTCPAFKFWGYEYILTKNKSVYGPGEYRAPVENNPEREGVFCKHLWVVASSLYAKQLKFAEGLVPFYKRVFGITTPAKLARCKDEFGQQEIMKLFEKAKKDVEETRELIIKKSFDTLIGKYFTNMNEKKLKEAEVLDQKEDNGEEEKQTANHNRTVMRGIEKLHENEKTVLDDLEEEGNEGDIQEVEE